MFINNLDGRFEINYFLYFTNHVSAHRSILGRILYFESGTTRAECTLYESSSNGAYFCNTTIEGVGGYHHPHIFKMNHRMMLILVTMVSLESPLNIDTK